MPHCGQKQAAEQVRFCSQCGLSMTGIGEFIGDNGKRQISAESNVKNSPKNSPRKKGLKQGLMIFLLTFLVVPLVAIMTIAANAEPFSVAIAAVLFFVGGVLRMIYAVLFESNENNENILEDRLIQRGQSKMQNKKTAEALPPAQTSSAIDYIAPSNGNWRDSKDLVRPSVIEYTIKFLNKVD